MAIDTEQVGQRERHDAAMFVGDLGGTTGKRPALALVAVETGTPAM